MNWDARSWRRFRRFTRRWGRSATCARSLAGCDKRFGDDTHYAPLVSATKDFDKKSLDLESQLLQVNAKSSESNLNYPVLIDERLHSLLFSVESGRCRAHEAAV